MTCNRYISIVLSLTGFAASGQRSPAIKPDNCWLRLFPRFSKHLVPCRLFMFRDITQRHDGPYRLYLDNRGRLLDCEYFSGRSTLLKQKSRHFTVPFPVLPKYLRDVERDKSRKRSQPARDRYRDQRPRRSRCYCWSPAH